MAEVRSGHVLVDRVETDVMSVEPSPSPRRFSPACSCCRAVGVTRRDVLAIGGALLGAGSSFLAPARAAAPPPSIDDWLRTHPNIAKAVVWDFGKGGVPYAAWPEPFKARLRAAFARAWSSEPSGLVDPPPNQVTHENGKYPLTVLSGTDAFALQAALVANSLAADIGRRLPWSVADYSEPALAALLDGRQTFARSSNRPDSYATVLLGVPAAPEACLDFLRTQRIIGASRRATIVQMLSWCRDQLSHFTGKMTAGNFEDHWQYRGMPPASRVTSGTRYAGAGFGTSDRRRHFTAGCWGTTSFLAAVLRTVNIPVQQLTPRVMNAATTSVDRHSAPYFVTEGLCLSHGDDPYNAYCRVQPSFDIEQILITKAQYDTWFPPGAAPMAGELGNVGRGVTDPAIKFLPITLLDDYAQDVMAGRSRESGKVLQAFKDKYTLAALEAAQLWQRLDARLAELGGPQKVRALYAESVRNYDQRSIATTVR
jgi:hypothetical protein